MKIFRILPAVLLYLFFLMPVFSQDYGEETFEEDAELADEIQPEESALYDSQLVSEENPSGYEETENISDTEGVIPEPELEETEPSLSLYEITMVKDIETAGYYELLAWCRSLELSDLGDSNTLRNSLFQFYDLNPSEKKSEDSNVSIITVHSAYNTDYFTVEENDQQMIVLMGGVEVEMVESGPNPRTHKIISEELIFNQTNQVITARGNLKYTLTSADSEDIFYGDSLDFSVSSWSGLIFKGTSLRTQEVEGEEQIFYFTGTTLKKSGKGGIFILDDGLIKTQDRDDPDFHLKAKKLWLMGPKEWGILSGILYVGHVPLVYIPFYYEPGNELIFNPVIGTKTRKGTFLQTTTYLIGQKDESEDDPSFFNLGENSDNYELVREGLYLFKEESTNNDPVNEDHLKFMADWYSKLGAYTGVDGSFSDRGFLNELDFISGMGVSRNVDSDENIYFENDSGEYVDEWNSTVLGDIDLPFRWGNDLTFTAGDFRGDLSFYSDPYFNEDFLDREENYDWLSSVLTSDDNEDDIPSPLTDMDWIITYSKTFQPDFLKPYVNSIAISPVRMNLEWDRRDNEASESSLDPSRVFFYPDKMNLPYASVSLSGKPVSYSSNTGWGWNGSSEEEELDDDRDKLSPPWDLDEEEKEDDSEEQEEGLIAAEPWSSLFTHSTPQFYSGSLSYSYSTDFNVEGYTDNDEWVEPGDVDFKMDESYFVSSNRLITTLDNSFLDSRILLVDNNTYTNNYRDHLSAFGLEDSDVEYQQKLSDYQARSIDWNNTFKTTVYPLKENKVFGATNITYNLDNQLYKKTFESYEEDGDPVYDEVWGDWEEETINQHKAGVIVNYAGDYIFASSNSSFNLPPLDRIETYTNTVGYEIFNWRTSLSQTSIREEKQEDDTDWDGEEWTFQPLIMTSAYNPHEKISLNQNLEYDLEEEELTKSYSSASFFGLYSSYTHEYTTPYSWDKENLSWVAEDTAFVPSNFTAGYNYDLSEWTFWKNRMRFSTDLDISWSSNLQQFNDNSLNFGFGFNYHVHEFLDLDFTMVSQNNNMYLYSEYYRDKLGIEENYNFIDDLFKSVNVFSPDQEDRYASNFKLSSINLEVIHHLRDWDLTFLYSGSPKLEDKSYEWYSEFSVYIIWNPIPQIKSLVERKEDEWYVENQ